MQYSRDDHKPILIPRIYTYIPFQKHCNLRDTMPYKDFQPWEKPYNSTCEKIFFCATWSGWWINSTAIHSSIKLTFLVSKGLLCLYDKQNNTWLLVDKKFLFLCSPPHFTVSSMAALWFLNLMPHFKPPKSIASHFSFSYSHYLLSKAANKS